MKRRRIIADDLEALLDTLPPRVVAPLRQRADLRELLEVVLDLGRPPEARFPSEELILDPEEVDEQDLQYVIDRIGEFGEDNRAGIPRTLHRISAIRNRKGKVVGLTCRVGRAVFGTIDIIEDLVFSGKSILLLGRPGVGKTTMLREAARVLADEARKRVIVVDTSNEIAGDGDIPHPGIGRARRMQVPSPALQHAVMIEAVENHMPEVIIIDEMGTELEAAAARTIAERGVQLIATAHGNTLENLILNPTLSDLVGGVQTATLSDEEARRRGTQKTILERKAPPTFDIVVEIQNWERVTVHPDVSRVVDAWLRGYPVTPEVRQFNEEGSLVKTRQVVSPAEHAVPPPQAEAMAERLSSVKPGPEVPTTRVLAFGVGREKVIEAASQAGVPVEVVNDLRSADILLTTKTHYRRSSHIVRAAEEAGKPVYVLRKNSVPQIRQFLKGMGPGPDAEDPVRAAVEEAQRAAERVLNGEQSVSLSPQQAYLRRLQHLIAEKYRLASTSVGKEPNRYVTIYRP